MAGIFRGFLDACATGQNDEVSQRDFLAAELRAVERALDALQGSNSLASSIPMTPGNLLGRC